LEVPPRWPPAFLERIVRKLGGDLDAAVGPSTTSQEDEAAQDHFTERQSVLLQATRSLPRDPLHRRGIRPRCFEPLEGGIKSVIPGSASGVRGKPRFRTLLEPRTRLPNNVEPC
jgi:hypothetical protein